MDTHFFHKNNTIALIHSLFVALLPFGMGAACSKESPPSVKKPAEAEVPLAKPAPASNPDNLTTLFDFHNNRLLAHQEQRGGLWIPAGSAGFAKYTHFNRPAPTWALHRKLDGKFVALAKAEAKLDVPLTAQQSQNTSVWLRVKSQTPSSITIRTGVYSSATVPLQTGWQQIEVKLPRDALHAGENKMVFVFARTSTWLLAPAPVQAAVAIDWVQIGGQAPQNAVENKGVVEGLHIASGGAFYHYMAVPKGSMLVAQGNSDGCALVASVTSMQNQELRSPVRLDGMLTPLSIPDSSEEAYRVGFHAQGSCTALALRHLRLVRPGAPIQVARPSKPRNIIFWLSDDTRADKFRLWNPKSRVETPNLDEFSKKATRFAVTYAQGNESRVSHASLFTGMYPATHAFVDDKAILASKFVTLPEVVKNAGLYTTAFVANGYITARWGFGEGWDVLKNHIHDGGGLRAENLVAETKSFLLQGPGTTNPFLVYLGAIDAHVSWRPHEPWISKYAPTYKGPLKEKGLTDPMLDKVVLGKMTLTEADKTFVVALYDSDISYTDQQFGKLLQILEQTGHLQDTMIVFTSDHGEEFWDNGRIGHGQSLRQELVHVPMWVYYPPLFPAGKVVEEGTELVDLLPTLADALGKEVPKDVQGESLIPLAQGAGAAYPRPAIASQFELAHTMRLGNYKLWVGGVGDAKLFHAKTDPKETDDLAQKNPVALRFVSDALALWLAHQHNWHKARFGVANNHMPEFANLAER